MPDDDAIELEEATQAVPPPSDHRPPMPEPPPVRLIAVEDVHLTAPIGIEKQLDAFYAGLLPFERESGSGLIYRAENLRLIFDVVENPPPREDFRAVIVEMQLLADLERRLVELEIEYERLKGLVPGEMSIVVRDPAGNLVSIVERRELM